MNIKLLTEQLRRASLRRDLPPPEERRRIREAAGLTQQDVADVLDVTSVAVVRWEKGGDDPGGREPGPAHASDYAELLRYLAGVGESVPA